MNNYLKLNQNNKQILTQEFLSDIKFENDFSKIIKFQYFDQKYKDSNYYINRYYKHPIYQYELIILYKNSIIENFLILRKIFDL